MGLLECSCAAGMQHRCVHLHIWSVQECTQLGACTCERTSGCTHRCEPAHLEVCVLRVCTSGGVAGVHAGVSMQVLLHIWVCTQV